MCQINFLRGKGYPQECRICFSCWLGDGDSCLIQEMQFGSTNRSSNIKLVIDDDVDVRLPTPKIAHTCPLVMHNSYIYSYNFHLHEEMLSTYCILMPKKCIIKQEKCQTFQYRKNIVIFYNQYIIFGFHQHSYI